MRIALVNSDRLLCDGLSRILRGDPSFQVSVCGDQAARDTGFDVCLLDARTGSVRAAEPNRGDRPYLIEHPEENGAVHDHNSPKVNFGCSEAWFKAGDDGTAIPFYLDPAAIGVLIDRSQTTSGMGVHPNDDGNKCISDLIWEADTLEPGVTPLKWKLSIPEAPKTDICQ